MPLSSKEKFSRSLANPFYGLAEELSTSSLAEQKMDTLIIKNQEKQARMDPAGALADDWMEDLEQADLLDIAESSLYKTGKNLYDFLTPGRAGDRTNEQIAAEADLAAGVTPEDRQRLVGEDQQRVIQDLAQGNYGDAALSALKAGPGTLADSLGSLAAIGGTSLATGGIGALANIARGVSAVKSMATGGKLFTSKPLRAVAKLVDKEPSRLTKIVSSGAKAATNVSVATADITQGNINEFRAKHGRDPTTGEAAMMYATNLVTMMPVPTIIKNMHIPAFKSVIRKEAKTLGKNIKGGSNFKNIMSRVVDSTKKVTAAGGAEAAQEYFQTWAEEINVNLAPATRDDFWKGIQEIIGNDNSQLQALAGAYLGGGAGAAARASISVPALAAGAAVDTAKGTVKVAAKTAVGFTKAVAKVIKKISDSAAYKLVSAEEREVILSEHASRKELVDNKVADKELGIKDVKEAKTISDLRGNESIKDAVSEIQQKHELSDQDLENPKTFKTFKQDMIRAYRGDIGALKYELSMRTGANFAKRAGINVGETVTELAAVTIAAVSPGVKVVVEGVKQYGEKAVAAVQELRSSTALGMIELAATAGKEESKQIIAAARSLSMDDLKRTVNVIKNINPELVPDLERIIASKQRILETAGLKTKKIITAETLNPVIKDISTRKGIDEAEVAAVSSAINESLAGTIDDISALEQVENALSAVEKTQAFKQQTGGAMSRDNVVINKRKLARARKRIERDIVLEARTAGEKVADVVVDVAKDITDKVRTKAKDVQDKIEAKAKERAETKVKISPGFKTVIEAIAKTLQDPKQEDALISAAPDFIKQMKRYGVNNRAEYEVFLEQFPELQSNMRFLKELDKAYPSNMIVDEITDMVSTLVMDTEQKIKDAYNKLNPPECKI